jgi:restriction system protein
MEIKKLAIFETYDDCLKSEREIFNKNFPGGPENVTKYFDNIKSNKELTQFSILFEARYEQNYSNHKIVSIEDVDIKNWSEVTLEQAEKLRENNYFQFVNSFHDKLIAAISNDPLFLNQVDWRELEQIVYQSLSGLGFDCELTRSAKDGGKDVVVKIKAKGAIDVYYIEVKHWRQKVGKTLVKHFLDVIVKDNAYKGLFLATNGYADTAINFVSEQKQEKLLLSDGEKIVTMCQLYSSVNSGVLINHDSLYDQIFIN